MAMTVNFLCLVMINKMEYTNGQLRTMAAQQPTPRRKECIFLKRISILVRLRDGSNDNYINNTLQCNFATPPVRLANKRSCHDCINYKI